MKAYQKELEMSDRDFESVLDDIYGSVEICGLTYSAGHALRMLDEVAFNEARNNYLDAEMTDRPIWVCDKCEAEFDNEDEANECCEHS